MNGTREASEKVAQDLVAAADAPAGASGTTGPRRGGEGFLTLDGGCLGLDLRERTRFERVRGGRAAPGAASV